MCPSLAEPCGRAPWHCRADGRGSQPRAVDDRDLIEPGGRQRQVERLSDISGPHRGASANASPLPPGRRPAIIPSSPWLDRSLAPMPLPRRAEGAKRDVTWVLHPAFVPMARRYRLDFAVEGRCSLWGVAGPSSPPYARWTIRGGALVPPPCLDRAHFRALSTWAGEHADQSAGIVRGTS